MRCKIYLWISTVDCEQSSTVGSKDPFARTNCASNIGRGLSDLGVYSNITTMCIINIFKDDCIIDTISRIGNTGIASIISIVG